MICQNCKTELPPEFKFCPNCGTAAAQKSFCPGCGKPTEAGWTACAFCGFRLTPQSHAAPPPPPPPQGYYEPRHGYHHGSSSGHHGDYNRKKGFLGRIFSS